MSEAFRPDIPIYIQIISAMQMRIATGHWRPGEKIPSVRDLAVEYGVNPNTMQRSLSELERSGLLYTERTSGRFVTDDAGRIAAMREEKAMEYVEEFLKKMSELGFNYEQISELIKREAKKRV